MFDNNSRQVIALHHGAEGQNGQDKEKKYNIGNLVHSLLKQSPILRGIMRQQKIVATSEDTVLEKYLGQSSSKPGFFSRLFKGHDNSQKSKKVEPKVAVGIHPKPIQSRPYHVPLDKPEVVLISGGTFMMGCADNLDCLDDESPIHKVKVNSFYLGKYEITFAQWDTCVRDGRCKYSPSDEGWKRGNKPVMNISWLDTQDYINWLNKRYDSHFRLPTEAEWEYVAQKGNKEQNKTQSWHAYNSGNQTHRVGEQKPTDQKIYDLFGNVQEWVADWYGRYTVGYKENPQGKNSGIYHIIRGGSWHDLPQSIRTSKRLPKEPTYRYYDLGFRIAHNK